MNVLVSLYLNTYVMGLRPLHFFLIALQGLTLGVRFLISICLYFEKPSTMFIPRYKGK